jgi:hypothetical protein
MRQRTENIITLALFTGGCTASAYVIYLLVGGIVVWMAR